MNFNLLDFLPQKALCSSGLTSERPLFGNDVVVGSNSVWRTRGVSLRASSSFFPLLLLFLRPRTNAFDAF